MRKVQLVKPHLPSHGTHQRVRSVRRLFDVDDGMQVELELGHVLASPESDVEEHVAVAAVERLVEAVLSSNDDQRPLLKQRLDEECQLRERQEAGGRCGGVEVRRSSLK